MEDMALHRSAYLAPSGLVMLNESEIPEQMPVEAASTS